MDDKPNNQAQSALNRIHTNISGIERAFGTPIESIAEEASPEDRAAAIERRQRILKDREEFIKLYQLASMSYIRGVLTRAAKDRAISPNDVGAVWSNLVTRLLEGSFTTFKHQGEQGSFRRWLKRVIANECKAYLKSDARALGAKGPKNFIPISDDFELGTEDLADTSMEDELRKTVIELAYQAMEDDGLYGVAVLFAAQRGGAFTSEELAEHLSQTSGKIIKVDAAKKRLQRGRELFAQILLEQVAKLDGTNDLTSIEETLVELNLMANCKKALKALKNT